MSVPKSVLRESLPNQLAPAGQTATSAALRREARVQGLILTLVLFVVPLAAYWPATFHDYGLRDDYSNLREAHEVPGTILRFCASHARPVYGWLLQASFGQITSVQHLQWMRLSSVLLLGAIALVMFRGLRALGWSQSAALCFALLVDLVPAAQVIAGWAIGWPYAATALLSLAGFFTVEGVFGAAPAAGRWKIAAQLVLATGLMMICALSYQPSALFYLVPLAGALIVRAEPDLKRNLRWLGSHLAIVTTSLGAAYGIMSILYSSGVFVRSGRVAFEQHWGGKLAWFFQETLPNGLSMLILNDNNQRDHGGYLACAAVVAALLLAGLVLEWRRRGAARGILWAVGLFGLPVFAAGISLVASERYATYRTIFAMTAVLLCFLVASVGALTEGLRASRRRWLAAATVALAAFMAQHHVYALIAVPQGNEWQIVLDGAKQVRLDGPSKPKIFAIASSAKDLSTATIYHDEFGSLSTNSEWVPKEMFKRAMHDLHPDVPNLESRYDISEGYRLPPGQHFDVVIDLHQLRRMHADN